MARDLKLLNIVNLHEERRFAKFNNGHLSGLYFTCWSVNGRHYSQSRRKYITKGKNWTGIRNYDISFFSSLIAFRNLFNYLSIN